MSLAAESPMHSSSSSDDFATFLDSELELASSKPSPEDDESDNDITSSIEEPRNKRLKLDMEDAVDIEGTTICTTSNENTGKGTYGVLKLDNLWWDRKVDL